MNFKTIHIFTFYNLIKLQLFFDSIVLYSSIINQLKRPFRKAYPIFDLQSIKTYGMYFNN